MSTLLLDRIESQFKRMEEIVRRGEETLGLKAARVSGWSVGQQVDHIIKANGAILSGILAGKTQTGPGISLTGRIVLLTGFIPRGVGKSPDRYLGAEVPAPELLAALAGAQQTLGSLRNEPGRLLSKDLVIRHPRFGCLTASQALHFAKIHGAHHLKIIQDIEDAAGTEKR
ncbi:MAG: DinB family protein [Acidobacteria bacterium]|nr:DinB family protein [Acidobacteriota bacterium]MCK6684537.1 DinB family protein [Thermoanaerobaculia bacterium]